MTQNPTGVKITRSNLRIKNPPGYIKYWNCGQHHAYYRINESYAQPLARQLTNVINWTVLPKYVTVEGDESCEEK